MELGLAVLPKLPGWTFLEKICTLPRAIFENRTPVEYSKRHGNNSDPLYSYIFLRAYTREISGGPLRGPKNKIKTPVFRVFFGFQKNRCIFWVFF